MAKVKDEGHEETEVVIASIEKKITKEYAQAEKEVSEKLDEYLRKFAVKDNIKRQAWLDGKITKEEYEQWRLGQIAVGKRWEEMKDSLAQDYTNAAEIAKSITDSHMPEVYAINHNYGTFQVEKAAHVDTSYTLYDTNAVERLFNDNNKLYHDYGIKVGKSIKEGKQLAWDKKQIQSVMTQSLLQGESIGKIATRLSKAVGDTDRKACIRNARTMATGVQNAGRVDSYKRAENMGIDMMQEWVATLDNRTRHEHRVLDGQRVKVGEKFQVDGYELAFPADPEGEAFLVYNCRCTLVPVLAGFEVDSKDLSLRNTNHMEDETYDEWKESHNTQSDPITKQDDIAETMKREYGREYKKLDSQTISSEKPKRSGGSDKTVTPLKYITNNIKDLYLKYNEPQKLTEKLSEKDIINKVAKKDNTAGSCTSVAFAFLANKMGYDVTDFRGDAGCDFFATTENIVAVSAFAGVKSEIKKGINDFNVVNKLLKTTKTGKQYILATAGHTSIIKKTIFGYKYLDLQQNPNDNDGIKWKSLNRNALLERFGCVEYNNIDGIPKEATSILIETRSLMKSKDFKNILGYINGKV